MQKRAILALLVALALPAGLAAHEGHEHKVMGTVTQVHSTDTGSQVEIKTTAGETVVLTVDAQTRFLKGKAAAALKDVEAGSRVVAKTTTEGKTTKASEIVIGEKDAAAPAAAKPHQHQH